MSPCVSGAAPGFDMSKTRSLDLTSKILKDRSPAFTRSPIPPSGSICAIRAVAGSGARCLEEPAITAPPPAFPPPAEEHAGESTKAATNTASIRVFFKGRVRFFARPSKTGTIIRRATMTLRRHIRSGATCRRAPAKATTRRESPVLARPISTHPKRQAHESKRAEMLTSYYSPPGHDHLQVIRGPHRRPVLRAVVVFDQRDQVLLQSLLPAFVERLESLLERPVVDAHEVDVVAGRREAPHEGASPGEERAGTVAEELAQSLLGPPPEGGLETGGRRHVLAHGLEQIPDVAVGNPVGHPDLAARLAHPHQLGCRLLLVGGKDRTDGRKHHVEGAVREGEVLGVALAEVHHQALCLCPLA